MEKAVRSDPAVTTTATVAPSSPLDATWDYLTASVRPSVFVEIELLVLTFCTGIQGSLLIQATMPHGVALRQFLVEMANTSV